MIYKSHIFVKDFPKEDRKDFIASYLAKEFERLGLVRGESFQKTHNEEEEMCIVEDVGRIVTPPYYICSTKEYTIPNGYRNHYFIVNAEAKIFDPLAWAYPFTSYADGLNHVKTIEEKRENPYEENEEPTILWATVRAIFKGNKLIRGHYKKDISRIYSLYEREDGLDKRAALSRAFAIAVSSLQKRGYLVPGSRQLTDHGKQRSRELEQEWGQETTLKKFKEYEEIIRQGRVQ